jgi:hypothetical protein
MANRAFVAAALTLAFAGAALADPRLRPDDPALPLMLAPDEERPMRVLLLRARLGV